MNTELYEHIAKKANDVATEITKINSNLGRTTSDEQRRKLSEQLADREWERRNLLATLAAMRLAEAEKLAAQRKAAEADQKKAAQEKVRVTQQATFTTFCKDLPVCEECGAPSKLNPDFKKQPIAYSPNFWGDANARFWVELQCSSVECGSRWRCYLDARTKREKAA